LVRRELLDIFFVFLGRIGISRIKERIPGNQTYARVEQEI